MMRTMDFARNCSLALGLAWGVLACTNNFSSNAEMVPASILDPDGSEAREATKRVEYPLAVKENTPHFPIPESAQKTDSGLRFVVFARGENHAHPTSKTNVTVHYEGRTTDGEVFDSSIARGEPTSFTLDQVIPGWREGVKLMTVGDSFRFWIPEKDAYRGEEGKPAGMLIFDVELIEMDSE